MTSKRFIIALMCIIPALAFAQQEKASSPSLPWQIGGGIGLYYEDYTGFQFTLTPEVNYAFTDKWGIGGALGVTTLTADGYTAYQFTLSPYARFTPLRMGKFALFIDMGFTMGALNDYFMASVGVKPGITVDITDHFTLMARCGFLGYSYTAGVNAFGLSVDSSNLAIGGYVRF